MSRRMRRSLYPSAGPVTITRGDGSVETQQPLDGGARTKRLDVNRAKQMNLGRQACGSNTRHRYTKWMAVTSITSQRTCVHCGLLEQRTAPIK